MSKQSEAKDRQGYVAKVIPSTCSNCAHFHSELALPSWMAERNSIYASSTGYSPYTVERHGIESNLRCNIGGFAVKKMGGCLLWDGSK